MKVLVGLDAKQTPVAIGGIDDIWKHCTRLMQPLHEHNWTWAAVEW